MSDWSEPQSLTIEEAQQIRGELITQLLDAIKQVRESDSGYTLRFSSSNNDLKMVSEWIHVERICNPFLRFKLAVESNGGPISVELAGPSGTQDFLRSELALSRWM
jgi:hypothetical protein